MFLIIGVVKSLQTVEELMSCTYIKSTLTTFYELVIFYIRKVYLLQKYQA
jgi:hypothetical protein